MAYKDEQVSLHTIPVKVEYGIDSTLGRMYAQVGLPTNLGTITAIDQNTGLISLTNNGGAAFAEYYGEYLEVLQTDAVSKGWPNNAGDVQFGNHDKSTFTYQNR